MKQRLILKCVHMSKIVLIRTFTFIIFRQWRVTKTPT